MFTLALWLNMVLDKLRLLILKGLLVFGHYFSVCTDDHLTVAPKTPHTQG